VGVGVIEAHSFTQPNRDDDWLAVDGCTKVVVTFCHAIALKFRG
jgi:hypothetical protein